jgi:hypothetical protein
VSGFIRLGSLTNGEMSRTRASWFLGFARRAKHETTCSKRRSDTRKKTSGIRGVTLKFLRKKTQGGRRKRLDGKVEWQELGT